MSNWIEHVKAYASQHNIPYKQAMTEAKTSYKSVEGGKFNMKKLKKTVNRGVKKVSKAIDKNGHYLDFIDEDLSRAVNTSNQAYKDISGGKMKMKNVLRKTKNTVKQAYKVAKELEPYIEASSGAGVGMNKGCPHCGSVQGGSFKAMGGGIQSSLISPQHPSFNPAPPKSIRKRQVEN